MAKRFTVTFSDTNRLQINDIIIFEQMQINEIKEIASHCTLEQLRDYEEEGKDLSYLTPGQKLNVIHTKNQIVSGKTSDQLRRQKIVKISLHSNIRMLERLGSDELSIIISLIDRIVDADMVLKAQFKGHPSLSYTMVKDGDPDQYKLPISFKWGAQGQRIIKMVTLVYKGAPPKQMSHKVAQDDKKAARMAAFKQKLIEQSRTK